MTPISGDPVASARGLTLGRVNPRDNGFDTIRLLAAIAVLVSHAFALTNHVEPLEGTSRGMTLGVLAVGAFFVISGLLITMSADRRPALSFGSQRARRLLPALFVCVVLCIALGALQTRLDQGEYWTDPKTWLFLGNAVFVGPSLGLPGVFDDYPIDAVNGSLWTLRYEVLCYGVSFAFARLPKGRNLVLIALWLVSLGASRGLTGEEGGLLFHLERMLYLFRFYGAGMLLYAYRDHIPVRAGYALVAASVTFGAVFIGAFTEVAATLGAYALVVSAYRAYGWVRAVTRHGDISYGVYLYAFPIQQLCVPLSMKTSVPWLTNIAVALPLTLLAGAVSWIAVERPFLRRPTDRQPVSHVF
jgi:peptidoglycan/LPS O-acetylase OafA/YrhL